MVCSLRLCTGTLPLFNIPVHSLHAQTNTTSLYCRAVMHHKYRTMKKLLLIPILLILLLLGHSCQNHLRNSKNVKKQQLIQIIKKAGFLRLPLSFEVLPDGLTVKYIVDRKGSDSLFISQGIFRICGFLPDTSLFYSVVFNYPCSAYPCPHIMTLDKNGNKISIEKIDAQPGCIDTPIESTSCYDSVWIDTDSKIRSISKVIGKITNPSTNQDEDICNMRKLEGYIDKNGKIFINQSDVILCAK